jgi:predicted N-acetyltransferase YhbS
MSQSLPSEPRLRTARPEDLDAIANLLVDRGEPADAVDHRLMIEDPDGGWESCAVVTDGDRIVSTAMLLDETLVLGGVAIPAGQVELVATDREYEGRGLVRALMSWAHERSARRGHLAQVMVGIPYFYRQFGYEYAIVQPQSRGVRGVPPGPDGYAVRPAGPDDIPAMRALQDDAQSGYDLRMPHAPACWRALVARDGSSQLLVERAGEAVATGRITPPDEEVVLGELAGNDPLAVHALVAHAASVAGAGGSRVMERPGSPAGDAVEELLEPPTPQAVRYYARVPDVVALLDHLRPVLSARLAASGVAGGSGEAVISFFRHHVRIAYREATVERVVPGGRMQAPAVSGGAGVAPDLAATLLFSEHGIGGLAERHADVYPGPREELMRALFPPVRADLLTFYLP